MDLFNLYAKIVLDTKDYEAGINDASDKTSSLASGLKSGLATAAKVGAAALTATTTAVAALTTASIDGYAQYEQLTGGVETLFKTSAATVMQYADNAYKTAGMTANAYMETVTSFSASLLQSLDNDTAAAAVKANQAITDMADNANKMGTSMEMIQNAYQGFAKQNFTMLDNLKLGYGGTKDEMQRLLDKAEELQAAQGNYVEYSIDSFADVVDAIHVVQTEIGITGTTALEASSTIQGSTDAMRSAWSNLVTGIADENQNLDVLIGNFVESVGTAADNILPRVEQILGGIGQLVSKLAPIIAEEAPKLVASVLPSFLQAGADLLNGIIGGLTGALPQLVTAAVPILLTLVEAITGQLPLITSAAMQIISTLMMGLAEAAPSLIPTIADVVVQIATALTDPTALTNIIAAALTLIVALADGLIQAIPQLVSAIPQIIENLVVALVAAIPQLMGAGLELMMALIGGIVGAIPNIVASIPQIISAIVNGIGASLSSVVDAGVNIVRGLWSGIQSMASWIWEKVSGFFSNIVSGVKNLLGIASPSKVFADMGKNMALGLGQGWDNEFDHIKKDIENGLDFGTGTVALEASGFVAAQRSASSRASGGGGDTYNFYSPKALDAVTAAREMKKAKQQLALGYV